MAGLRKHRRSDDKALHLVLAQPTGWVGREHEAGSAVVPLPPGTATHGHDPEAGPWRRDIVDAFAPGTDVVLLLDTGGEEAVMVAGAACGRLRRGQDDELMERLAAGADAWRQERLRMEKRQRLPDRLIAFFEALNQAESEGAVFDSVRSHAVDIVGGHRAAVLLRDEARGMLVAPRSDGEYRLGMLWDDRLARPGVISADEARWEGGASWAAPLFAEPSVVKVAHVPLGRDAVLLLTERRDEREFDGEDWHLLRALTLQGEMALKRMRLIDHVQSLSLTDHLTGLANRRHMDVVLEHAWAAARRGEPLTVIVLDLDDFKEVNDREGHVAGDRLLRHVADVLREESRGSDVVVRYGGDEFLVILPGGEISGARALVERVRARLAGRVGFSEGIASYAPAHASPEQLIQEADRRLYETKRQHHPPRERRDELPRFPHHPEVEA